MRASIANVTMEFAGLGGDAKFVKLTARGTVTITRCRRNSILSACWPAAAAISRASADDDLRIFDHFQSSDRMIRGFEYGRHRSV